jgi:hydroxyacylglutathione hydrolase
MNDQIIPMKLKITNCFLIKGSQGYLMVDAGPPKSISEFQAAMKDLVIAPEDIKMIFITHGHWDHWGSLSGIVELTGAETAINYREAPWLEEKRVRIPGGIGIWGKSVFILLSLMKSNIKAGLMTISADIALKDEEFSLGSFGIKGKILHTPGHTEGSMSLLLDSGDAFVGDLAMSGFPRINGPGPFVLGEDIKAMKRSWQLLLEKGAVKIWPSHGNPFSANVLREYFNSDN